MDYEHPSSVEDIEHEVVVGEVPLPCYDVVDVVVETSFVVAAVVGKSFVVVEPIMPFEHWLEVLCFVTLQMDHVDCNDQMDFVLSFLHVRNLHFEVEVVSSHVRLRISYLVIVCQNHRPESKYKGLKKI